MQLKTEIVQSAGQEIRKIAKKKREERAKALGTA